MGRMHSRRLEELTFGVEEEFVLVDPGTRVTVPRAPEVLKVAADTLDERVAHELYATQIEAHTRPLRRAEDLRADLVEGRRVLAEAAARADCLLVASGSAVLTATPPPLTDDARYARMAERYPAAATGVASEASGCHIHVGELESDEAVALACRLRPWLPVLQAPATNSPFAGGEYRRCASWRYFELQAWPTVGPTPLIPAGGYETLASDLVGSGALMDRKMIYWYGRPSEHQPTLEIRVPDVNADVDVPLLMATLTRALAMVLRAEDRRGLPCPRPSGAEIREAHWLAATYGPGGMWTHPDSGERMPLSAALRVLIERALPALEQLGEAHLVEELMRGLTRHGTGAQRQRAVHRRRGRLTDVVDDLAARTVLS